LYICIVQVYNIYNIYYQLLAKIYIFLLAISPTCFGHSSRPTTGSSQVYSSVQRMRQPV